MKSKSGYKLKRIIFPDSAEVIIAENSSFTFRKHFHDSLIISYVFKGKRFLNISNKDFIFNQGDIFIINPGEIHSCNGLSKLPCSYISICMKKHIYSGLLKVKYTMCNQETDMKNPLVNDYVLRDLFEKLLFTIKEPDNSLKNQDLISEIIFRVRRNHKCKDNANLFVNKLKNIVEETKLYISGNCNKNIELNDISSEIGLSKFHLSRLFSNETGVTLHDYITQLRLKKGISLIDDGMTLSRAAYETGFADQSHFTKVFRKYNGVTPGEFGAAKKNSGSPSAKGIPVQAVA